MGMSASQARLLSITARMNDVEFKSQSISNTKIRLADESEEVSKAYTEALNASKLTYTTYTAAGHVGEAYKVDLTISNLRTYMTDYKLMKRGTTDTDVTNDSAYNSVDEYTLYQMIESGEFYLAKKDTDTNSATYGQFLETSVSGDNALGMGTVDSVKLAKAEADYNAATPRINRKEKLLDNELKALDTEHSALKTEQDAIKSLISDNVDKTFNIFS